MTKNLPPDTPRRPAVPRRIAGASPNRRGVCVHELGLQIDTFPPRQPLAKQCKALQSNANYWTAIIVAVQYNAMQGKAMQRNAWQRTGRECKAMQCMRIPSNVKQCKAMQRNVNAKRHKAMECKAMPSNAKQQKSRQSNAKEC